MLKPIVAITRPFDRAKAACDIVEELGGVAYLSPTLELTPVNSDSLKELISRKSDLDWIVFTSPTTIDAIEQFYPDFLDDLNCKIAVIGRKTAEIAENHNLKVDLIPTNYTAEGLIEEFTKQNIKNQIIGVPRTASARDTLPNGLKELNNEVIVAEAYKSMFPEDIVRIEYLIEKIFKKEIDAITFTSPLTVENLFKVVENKEEIAEKLSKDVLTVAIGPITGRILDKYNVSHIYPETYTVKDMMELLFDELEKSQ